MGKLTKQETKFHNEACAILEKDILSFEEKEFVLDHWRPDAEFNVASDGVFFTPESIAVELSVAVGDCPSKVLDLCAGIGRLSFTLLCHSKFAGNKLQITAIEKNPRYVEVGKKIVPEATWICMDVFNEENWNLHGLEDGHFDIVVSNPPFGNLGHSDWKGLRVPADMTCVAIGLDKAKYGGVYILPSGSVPWNYSGRNKYSTSHSMPWKKLQKFYPDAQSQCCSIDLSIHSDEWRDVSPSVEIADIFLEKQ